MIQYGLISKIDAQCIERTIDSICDQTNNDVINVCEVGIFAGDSCRGIRDYIISKGKKVNYTAIDNQNDFEVQSPFPECNFIIGNSNEVYNKLKNFSQDLIFIDGNHAFPSVISDFFCYQKKVKNRGFILFHDTAEHITEKKDYQGYGDKEDSDFYISVRKALSEIGLLDNRFPEWELIQDVADEKNEAGGICSFQKHIVL